MSSRVTVRFAPEVLGELERLAHQQGQSLAGCIRHHLEAVMRPTEPSAAQPGDAWEMLLMRCPDEVQLAVRQTVDGTGLGVANVLRSLVIAAVTGAAGIPLRSGASLDVPASSRVSGERTGREDLA